MNPWGWTRNTRRNAQGIDLNRDFASFKTKESMLVRDFARGRAYDLIVDHHEDSVRRGFYLYQLANAEDALCRRVVDQARARGWAIEQHARMVVLKTRNGILRAPEWTLRVARAARQLSMTNYFRLAMCPRVFLFETPSRLPMEDRVAMHRVALDVLLTELAAAPRAQCVRGSGR